MLSFILSNLHSLFNHHKFPVMYHTIPFYRWRMPKVKFEHRSTDSRACDLSCWDPIQKTYKIACCLWSSKFHQEPIGYFRSEPGTQSYEYLYMIQCNFIMLHGNSKIRELKCTLFFHVWYYPNNIYGIITFNTSFWQH